jgi:hypothetical protein
MFRFTIRDVLWLMVVVGVSLCLRSQFIAYQAESAMRRNWEQTARSVAKSSSFSVKFHDDGTCTFYPRGYDFSKLQQNSN